MFAIAAPTGSTRPVTVDIGPPGAPAAGEVLCRTLELGVCGTDREILLSAKPWTPEGEDKLILGHECLARIEAVGASVTGFQAGDLVVPVVRRPLAGQTRRADLLPFGAFVERGIVREHGFSQPLWLDQPEHLFRVPADIVDLAVLTEPLTCAEKACNEALLLSRARLGDDAWTAAKPPRVLVTGMGPIGFAGVLAAVARGWPVTMIGRDEPDTFRAQLDQRLGGEYLPLDDHELKQGDIENNGYDLFLECTGSEAVLITGANLVRSCGVIVWLGSSRMPHPTTHNIQKMIREGLLRNHIHVGSVNAAPRDFHDALAHLSLLAKNRRAELAALITARVSPDKALWHYEHREPQGIKTVVMYS
ncbi:MAG: alcohol dehydrogenase catalytic domain-containing protein [Planctomycetia bacterium]|nr:alcohol dehydrogenase catalytic domain-containing protein [Planctomycetia bacterium]